MVGWMYTIWYSDPQIHDSEEREAMKQMKRAAGLLLALVLVLSMAACGKKDEPSTSGSVSGSTGTSTSTKSDKFPNRCVRIPAAAAVR
mgnify:CR=1 FL=1